MWRSRTQTGPMFRSVAFIDSFHVYRRTAKFILNFRNASAAQRRAAASTPAHSDAVEGMVATYGASQVKRANASDHLSQNHVMLAYSKVGLANFMSRPEEVQRERWHRARQHTAQRQAAEDEHRKMIAEQASTYQTQQVEAFQRKSEARAARLAVLREQAVPMSVMALYFTMRSLSVPAQRTYMRNFLKGFRHVQERAQKCPAGTVLVLKQHRFTGSTWTQWTASLLAPRLIGAYWGTTDVWGVCSCGVSPTSMADTSAHYQCQEVGG